MANTYVLIASNTLSATATTVTFSSIPATYTDLVLRWSIRTDQANTYSNVKILFNSSTSNYSTTRLSGNGSSAESNRTTTTTPYLSIIYGADGANATSNTFSNGEIYIPSYAGSTTKPSGTFTAQENNTTAAYINAVAGLWNDTSAITSIEIAPVTGGVNFVSGSSFYLYGIKNS